MRNTNKKFTEIETFLKNKNVTLTPADLEELRFILDKREDEKAPLVSPEEINEILKITDALSNI